MRNNLNEKIVFRLPANAKRALEEMAYSNDLHVASLLRTFVYKTMNMNHEEVAALLADAETEYHDHVYRDVLVYV